VALWRNKLLILKEQPGLPISGTLKLLVFSVPLLLLSNLVLPRICPVGQNYGGFWACRPPNIYCYNSNQNTSLDQTRHWSHRVFKSDAWFGSGCTEASAEPRHLISEFYHLKVENQIFHVFDF